MDLDEVRATKEQHGPRLIELPGVTGVGVGYLADDETIGIVVYLEEGSGTQIPDHVDGVPVEVRPGRFSAPFASLVAQAEPAEPPPHEPEREELGNPRDKEFQPMIGGISCNPDFFYFFDWSGTLGLTIADSTGSPVILSNRHVICGKEPKKGDGVSQPSYEIFSHLAASLDGWKLGNVEYNGLQYGIDAAIASPTNDRTASIGEVYSLPKVTGSATPALSMNVQKSGLTTDVTTGTVTAIEMDVATDDNVILKRQVIVRANDYPKGLFANTGDSGSVIIDFDTNKVIALLWGGNDKTKETIGSPIGAVLAYFNCTIP